MIFGRRMPIRDQYPSIGYLREAARARIPYFAWEYLDSGTGLEAGLKRNREALDAIEFNPQYMGGYCVPTTETELFGKKWGAPLGISPVGLCGLMWPGAEKYLAQTAANHGIPYCLSMVACETPETIGPLVAGNGWFQLYPIRDHQMEDDLLKRAWTNGFETLVVTVDVPISSTRERQRRAGVAGSRQMTLSKLFQILSCPSWAIATVRRGAPNLRSIAQYGAVGSIADILQFVTDQQMGATDQDHLTRLRDNWLGNFVIKGILDPRSAEKCLDLGADGVIVSNHGARQLDAAPAAIDVLSEIADLIGSKIPIMFDSGVRTGLDIARALAIGADFVFAGRAFLYGVCAGERDGADAAAQILIDDLVNNMMQVGAGSLADLPKFIRGRET